MRKGWIIAAAVILGLYVIGSLMPSSDKPSLRIAASASPSPETSAADPLPTPDPSQTDETWPTPELSIDDLGEGNCKKFEVCTFVTITANATCKNAEIDIDLFDENDEDYDTEGVLVGTIKKGTTLRNVEVGTDDTDAAYVEQSDFICG